MKKPTILFFTGYLLLMVSLIYFGMTSKIELSKPKNEVSSTFSKELAIQEEKGVEKAEKEKKITLGSPPIRLSSRLLALLPFWMWSLL